MNISRGRLTRLPRTMFHRPQRSWLRKNSITSAISAVQKIPAPFRRRLITLRMALSTAPLPVGRLCSLENRIVHTVFIAGKIVVKFFQCLSPFFRTAKKFFYCVAQFVKFTMPQEIFPILKDLLPIAG